MNKELKFAIIGCGRIAQRHAEHIAKQATLAAVCDVNEACRNEMAKNYNCKAWKRVRGP